MHNSEVKLTSLQWHNKTNTWRKIDNTNKVDSKEENGFKCCTVEEPVMTKWRERGWECKKLATVFSALIFLVSLQQSDYLWITSALEKSKWKRRNASSMKNWFVLHCFRHYSSFFHFLFPLKVIIIEDIEETSCGEKISHFPTLHSFTHSFINWFSISVFINCFHVNKEMCIDYHICEYWWRTTEKSLFTFIVIYLWLVADWW